MQSHLKKGRIALWKDESSEKGFIATKPGKGRAPQATSGKAHRWSILAEGALHH